MSGREEKPRPTQEKSATVRRRERERERHRLDILECAGRLFAERGFERTTMQDISSASGFALASIYKHFTGKDQIYDAMVSEAVRSYFVEIQRRFAQVESPIARIRTAIEVTVEHVERNRAVSEVVLREVRGLGRTSQVEGSEPATGSISARAGYLAVLTFFEGLFSEARNNGELVPGVDPRAAALVLVGAMFANLAYWLHYAGPGERMDAAGLLRVVLGPVASG